MGNGLLELLLSPFAQTAVEQAALPPKIKISTQDPIGQPSNTDPMADADRGNPVAVISAALRTAQERARTARYADFELMDTGDIQAALDATVDSALAFEEGIGKGGFDLECEDQGALQIMQLGVQQTGLNFTVYEIARDMLKYGDAFAEPVFDKRVAVDVQTYRPAEMFRAQNDKGRLPTGNDDAGFPAAFQQKRSGQIVAGWNPWEMVHFRLYPEKKLAYSRASLLDGMRLDWRKLQLVEQAMVVARITRAYPKRKHYLDFTNKPEPEQRASLREYILRMTNSVLGQRSVTTDNMPVIDVGEDLYIGTGYMTDGQGVMHPKLNKVELEDPSLAGIAKMDDIKYLRGKLFSKVPSDVVGIERNSETLDSQDVAYARLLQRLQRQLEQGLRMLLDSMLLASGRIGVEYRIVFPTISTGADFKHSQTKFNDSMTVRNYLETKTISRRRALKRSFGWSDAEVDENFAEIEQEDESGVFDAPDTTPNAPGPTNAGPDGGANGEPTVPGNADKGANAAADKPAKNSQRN